jgi:hypothetical protein
VLMPGARLHSGAAAWSELAGEADEFEKAGS